MGTRVHPSWPPQLEIDTQLRPRDGPVQHRKLSLSAKEDLKSALDAVMAKYRAKLPGTGFGITSADGAVYEAYMGDRVHGEPKSGPVDSDTTYMIYSMTKLVTSLAVLQAVESGLLSYDDPACLERYVPELCSQKVLLSCSPDTGPVFEDRKEPLTLRHLVTHTSGLVYGAMDPAMQTYLKSTGRGEVPTANPSEMEQPLRAQPGTKWMYGPGLDWAGVVLERSTEQPLESLFRERIFDPLGISTDTSFAPRVEKWQHTVRRTQSGLELAEPMQPTTVSQEQGGEGLWSTLPDYLTLCAGVLRSSQPGGIISPESCKSLWEDSVPATTGAHSDSVHRDLARFLSNAGADASPDAVGHSVAGQVRLKDVHWGRKRGSASWGGAGLTQFCIDPRSGIAFVAMTQIEKQPSAPAGEEPFIDFWAEMEKTLYEYL